MSSLLNSSYYVTLREHVICELIFLQGFVELAALEDILDPYLDDDSRNNFELSKKHLGSWDIEGNER